MNPKDLYDWATNLYEGGGDAHLADVLDDCATAWEEDQERIAELERERGELAAFHNEFMEASASCDSVGGAIDLWKELRECAPIASLARRDKLVAADEADEIQKTASQWEVDALEVGDDEAASAFEGVGAYCIERADRLRREAEGDEAWTD